MAGWLRRRDRTDAAFLVLAAVAGVILMALGLGLTFFADEWAFIESRSLADPATWFAPHNEHWSTLPILAYRAMVETIGIGSYVPYLAVLIALHIVVAGLVYVLIRRRNPGIVSLGAAAVVLFLGSGFENLFWGFQIGFVGSMAFGLGAIAVLEGPPTRGRTVVGFGLLIAGLMTSGVGVTFVVVVAVELLLDPKRRRLVPVVVVPVALYLLWYVLIGRSGITTFAVFRDPFSLAAVADAPPTIAYGIGNTFGAVAGVGPVLGIWVGLVALVASGVWLASDPRGPGTARFVGCLAGIVTQYALIGVLRGALATDVTNYTRYTYVSAILLIVGGSALLPRLRTLPATRVRRIALLGGGSLLALSLVWNVRLLMDGRALFGERAEMTRALVTVGLARPLPAEVDADRSLVLVPSPASLARIVSRYGSPVGDGIAPGSVGPIPAAVTAEALRRLIEGAVAPVPGTPASP